MRLCNYRLMNAIVFLIKMLVECKYLKLNNSVKLKSKQVRTVLEKTVNNSFNHGRCSAIPIWSPNNFWKFSIHFVELIVFQLLLKAIVERLLNDPQSFVRRKKDVVEKVKESYREKKLRYYFF